MPLSAAVRSPGGATQLLRATQHSWGETHSPSATQRTDLAVFPGSGAFSLEKFSLFCSIFALLPT